MTKYRFITLYENGDESIGVDFSLPTQVGKYKMIAKLINGKEIECGNIKVGNLEHKYRYTCYDEKNQYCGQFIIKTPTISLDTLTWQELKEIARSGKAKNKIDIGAIKKITLSTGEEIELVVLGINHDTLSNVENPYYNITFGLLNTLQNLYVFGSNATNWSDSDIRNVYLPQIQATLPTELQSIIENTKKRTNGVETIDKLFLLSYIEALGTNKIDRNGEAIFDSDEGYQYEYYENVAIPQSQTPDYTFIPLNEATNKGSFWVNWNGEDTDGGFSGFIDKNGQHIYLEPNIISNANITNTRNQGVYVDYGQYWLRSKDIRSLTPKFGAIISSNGSAMTQSPIYDDGISFAFCI